MSFRSVRTRLKVLGLSMCIALWMQGIAGTQQPQPQTSGSTMPVMGPVGEKDAAPLTAAAPANSVVDQGIIPSRQLISPAGLQSVFASRVYGVVFGEHGDSIYAATVGQKGSNVYQIDLKTNHMMAVLSTDAAPGMQGLAYDLLRHQPLMSGLAGKVKGGGTNSEQLIALDQGSSVIANGLGTQQIGGLAVGLSKNSTGRRLAVVALTFNDEAAVIDLDTKEVYGKIKTGVAPFGVVVSADSSVAWVSNRCGRFAHAGEQTAATGPKPNADRVLVDDRGVASSGTVTRIDLIAGKVTAEVNTGLHPSGMAWDEEHHRLYIANSNSDSISVVDTASNRVVDTFAIEPFVKKAAGVSPESVALSPDHATLYAACAGINAVAVIDLTASHPRLAGLIPTGGIRTTSQSAQMESSLPFRPCWGLDLAGTAPIS